MRLADELLLHAQMAADGADKSIHRRFILAKADKLCSEVCNAFTFPPRSPFSAFAEILGLGLYVFVMRRGGGAVEPAGEAADSSQGRLRLRRENGVRDEGKGSTDVGVKITARTKQLL